MIAFDYNYTFWDVYEGLTFEFDSINDPDRATVSNPRNYKNSSTYRLGLQHQTTNKLQLTLSRMWLCSVNNLQLTDIKLNYSREKQRQNSSGKRAI